MDLASGQVLTGLNFGITKNNAATGSIAAYPFEDQNANKVLDAGEKLTDGGRSVS